MYAWNMDWRHLNLDYYPTKKQEDTIRLMCTSLSQKEIADKRGVARGSIQDMLLKLYRKTGARDRFELCIWAIKKGYVSI